MSSITIINGVVINGSRYGSGKSLQGNGELAKEKRELSGNFDRVEISNGIRANIEVGRPTDGVTLSGDSNILPEIETRIREGKLIVSPADGVNLNPKNPVEATFFMADLSGITASTSAAVNATGVASASLKLNASTSAKIKVEGGAERVKADASTSGTIVGRDLSTKDAVVDASTSGSILLNVSDSLFADASTSGEVFYIGSPSVKKDTSTGGSVGQY